MCLFQQARWSCIHGLSASGDISNLDMIGWRVLTRDRGITRKVSSRLGATETRPYSRSRHIEGRL